MLILWYNNDNFVQLANEMLLLTGSPGNRTQRSRRRGDCQRNLQRQRPPRILSGVGGGSLFDNCDGLLVMMMTKAWTSIETTMTTFLERQEDDDNDEDDVDDGGVDAKDNDTKRTHENNEEDEKDNGECRVFLEHDDD